MKALQVVLALSILILIHELGHFSFSKLFKVRVDKFYLFFDAGNFHLLSTKSGWFSRLFPRLKERETEYGIGWLPLGGYCKINGMVDESMDTEQLKEDPKPYEFRTKPAWQRLLIMAGGVLFNFIFAIIVYICMMYAWGEAYISNSGNSIIVNDLAYDMGFRDGDRILSFDDYTPENFGMLQVDLARRKVHKALVLRGGDTLEIYIDQSRIAEVLNSDSMFSLAVPFVVDSIPPTSPNWGCGIVRGDKIVEVNGEDVSFVQDSRAVLSKHANETVPAVVVRGDDSLRFMLQVDSSGLVGIYASLPGIEQRSYSVLGAIPAGVKLTFDTIGGYLSDLRLVATPSTGAYKSVGSFIAIGQVFPAVWNWYSFLYMLALLSIMLGVMNLIPIPGLDGGHILFTLYEMVTRRKPSLNFLIVAQWIGMILLIMLMILAFGNDIGRLLR